MLPFESLGMVYGFLTFSTLNLNLTITLTLNPTLWLGVKVIENCAVR